MSTTHNANFIDDSANKIDDSARWIKSGGGRMKKVYKLTIKILTGLIF